MKTLPIIFGLIGAAAFGQQTPTENDAVFRSDTRLVELHVGVTDSEGHLVTNLPESAFHVFENDVSQEIKVFKREDAPVSMGLIIDNSVSMRDKRAKVASAALTLVRASNPGDEVFIVNFNEQIQLIQEFTRDPAQMERTLSKIDSNGATALRDALDFGIAHLKRLGANDTKVLLVVTDGEDNSSGQTLARLARAAQQSGVLIYAIGLLSDTDEQEAARAKRDLDTLTLGTGGEVFYPQALAEVEGIALQVAKDIRSKYTIGYTPTDQRQDGTFRRVRVTVSTPAGAVVRTRSGYYATTPGSS
jgi:Ca-activated chloride channel homolog